MSLADVTVLVTAGASGAGLVIAREFLAAGAKVAICDIDVLSLKQAEKTGLFTIKADVSAEDEVERLFCELESRLGAVEVLINNVGIAGPTAAVENITLADWQQSLGSNLTSHFLCIRRAVPGMKAAGSGTIINISSGSAKVGLPLRTPYVVTKGAILSLTRTLARELGPSGIRVNSILPGAIRGERVNRIIAQKAEALGVPAADYEQSLLRYISLRTMVEPEDVAAMCIFLASEHGRRVTGQMIGVDGNVEWEE